MGQPLLQEKPSILNIRKSQSVEETSLLLLLPMPSRDR